MGEGLGEGEEEEVEDWRKEKRGIRGGRKGEEEELKDWSEENIRRRGEEGMEAEEKERG